MQKKNSRRKEIRILLILIGIILFKLFVWDEYIVNSTADAALNGVEGEAGVMHVISEKQELAIRPYDDGFKLYAVSKGFWGWSITDEMWIGNEKEKTLKITEQTLQFKPDQKLYMSLVVDKKQSFDKVTADSTTMGAINFNRTVGDNAFLYYYYSNESLGDIIYEGTRLNGETEKLARDNEPN